MLVAVRRPARHPGISDLTRHGDESCAIGANRHEACGPNLSALEEPAESEEDRVPAWRPCGTGEVISHWPFKNRSPVRAVRIRDDEQAVAYIACVIRDAEHHAIARRRERRMAVDLEQLESRVRAVPCFERTVLVAAAICLAMEDHYRSVPAPARSAELAAGLRLTVIECEPIARDVGEATRGERTRKDLQTGSVGNELAIACTPVD